MSNYISTLELCSKFENSGILDYPVITDKELEELIDRLNDIINFNRYSPIVGPKAINMYVDNMKLSLSRRKKSSN